MTGDERFSISPSVRTRQLDGELIVLDLDQGEYYSLNSSGAQVWKALEAGQGIAWICDEVVAHWPISREEGMEMVSMIVQDLLQRGLIVRAS
ncbi:MAG: PqqD family protein [Gemmatimonadota bacterium]